MKFIYRIKRFKSWKIHQGPYTLNRQEMLLSLQQEQIQDCSENNFLPPFRLQQDILGMTTRYFSFPHFPLTHTSQFCLISYLFRIWGKDCQPDSSMKNEAKSCKQNEGNGFNCRARKPQGQKMRIMGNVRERL